ncbi:MAG: beta-propeller domain-containing protein [Acidimicrobiia bacterium]|nr:beta-propeller domain-containing protein [Acidimicrobiia bacterium]
MRRLILLLLTFALVASACATGSSTATTDPSGSGNGSVAGLFAGALVQFDHCDDLLDWIRGEALQRVGPWGIDGANGPWMWATDDVAFAVEESASDGGAGRLDSAPTASQTGGSDEFSTTNVQEVGVDEPDIVKTDGQRIVAVAEQRLYVIDVTGDEPVLLDSILLDTVWISEIVMSGDRILVLGNSDYYSVPMGGARDIAPGPWGSPLTVITEIDMSDPSDLTVARELFLDGSYLSARMVDDTVRIVLRAFPTGLEFEYPTTSGLRAEREAEEANKEVIENSTIDNWVPYYVLEDHRGAVSTTTEGNLLSCGQTFHPDEFSGFGMLTVLTVDLSEGIDPDKAVGVMADGETVYASADSLYVATTRWVDWARIQDEDNFDEETEGYTTAIHKFDISNPDRTVYRATGEIPGHLLSQWSMSEHNGYLRVASTDAGSWWGWRTDESESFLTILEEDAGKLEQVGQVGELGLGEQIYAVRMMEDTGYVVTFRQTDPLYVIDLSDPRAPSITGELKILGYSAYLHPIGDGLLLGVGQDATEEGRVLGTQIAVFDVSDPANPQRLHKMTLEDGSSEVEYDHRAFLHWPATGLTVVPVQRWSWDEEKGEDFFAGAVGIKASRDGIEKIDTISHMTDGVEYEWDAQIRRSIVIGDSLYTLSFKGLLESDLETLEELSFLDLR